MNYFGPFAQAYPAVAAPGTAIYSPCYGGETLYVWPAFGQTPEPSPVSSEYNSPSYAPSPGYPVSVTDGYCVDPEFLSAPRSIKRRVTANRKERRRTLSINNAFAELRECIPNVPSDTKMSKIKILRLATSYIAHLMEILQKEHSQDERPTFKTDPEDGGQAFNRQHPEFMTLVNSCVNDRKSRGRTGWPQLMWALELKQENAS